MINSDEPGGRKPTGRPSSNCRRSGCLRWGLLAILLNLVFCGGLGLPNQYWHCVGAAQVFEGPESIMLFVEVQLATRRPGLVQSPRVVRKPARLVQIEVSEGGESTTTFLTSDSWLTFNSNLTTVFRLDDGFYLMQSSRLYRIHEGRIESLLPEEVRRLREFAGLETARPSSLDRVSERYGWHRLGRTNFYCTPGNRPLVFDRHGLRIWCDRADRCEVIRAGSKNSSWEAILLTVNTERWRSYQASPMWRFYQSRSK